jgi:Pyruvate/2-oxoacid:ferredoxin oxidoreductase delta subunit/bacterioferritin-associated ferredoxin
MKVVSFIVEVDKDKCTGCGICTRVCPTLSIKVVEKLANVDANTCAGCGACLDRCPFDAVRFVDLETPKVLVVDPESVDKQKIVEICKKAKIHPEQIVCFCTGTRAEEVAAAILQGAESPEEISRRVGVRTGCKTECIQPILRLLYAADIAPTPPEKGWQWYGKTPTIWEVPREVKRKYSPKGFYFEGDEKLLNKVMEKIGKS